ncbi:DegV family protein [Clostridium sp. DL1XJH146]
MKYRIVADTSCDLEIGSNKLKDVKFIPFTIQIDEHSFKDIEKTQIEMIELMADSPHPAKTSCPSPNDFIEAFEGDDDEVIFVVTISSNLSGTYNSAVLAKKMYLEEHNEKEIYLIDSKSAASAETCITYYLMELLQNQQEMTAAEIYRKAISFVKEMRTLFILEDLNNLMKNGRLNKVKGIIANLLHIKLILGEDGNGEITLYKKARGTKRAYKALLDSIEERSIGLNIEEKEIFISHCNALQKALDIKEMIKERYNFKNIHILETNGLSTIYTSDGGVVLTF